MVQMNVIYQGQKHCELTHEPSGSHIETDAPKDNQGKGERFSPTDLVGAALASCILTTMAIVGEREGLEIKGARATVKKDMQPSPRRIAALSVHVILPASLSPAQRQKMEETARSCPVHKSLHEDVRIPLTFEYRAL